jgi:hypothetical protein
VFWENGDRRMDDDDNDTDDEREPVLMRNLVTKRLSFARESLCSN